MDLRKTVFITGITICTFVSLGVGWFSLREGVADAHANEALALEKIWMKTSPPEARELRLSIEATRRAIHYSPRNPEYRDQIARYLIISSLVNRDSSKLAEAQVHLLVSRKVRPFWGRNWATYINLKRLLNEIDRDLSDAILEATRVAPREAVVIQAVVRVGVEHYRAFPEATKNAIRQTIIRGLESSVPGLPDRVYMSTMENVQHWSLEFTRDTIDGLVARDWTKRGGTMYAKLALQWWLIATPDHQRAIAIKASDVIANSKSSLLADQPLSVRQHLCGYLPFNKRPSECEL